MADTKISALPSSTTPLAGTEVLPIVQGGAARQVSVANLTAGRALSATQLTLTTGNLIVASGKGIDFSATPGTGTSELLADYEEGTWTPTVTPEIGSFTSVTNASGVYTKVGNFVTMCGRFTLTNSGTGAGSMTVTGLPFSASSGWSSAQELGRRINDGALLISQISGSQLQTLNLANGLSAIANGNLYTISAAFTV